MTETTDYRAEYDTLRAEVEHMGNVLAYADTDNIWEHFACLEVDSIADVLRAVGRWDTAAMIIDLHAADDDEYDRHHPDYDPENEV